MILEVVRRSAASVRALIPVAALANNATGSRMPEVDAARLTPLLAKRLVEVCPTSAFALNGAELTLDLGRCIGCGECIDAAADAVTAAAKIGRCGVSRPGLVRRWDIDRHAEISLDQPSLTDTAKKIRATVGRALNIRQVDAGSCNGCEGEIVALNNPYYDLERFGIHFVASPKHADMLLVTGPVTRNMETALKQTYEATPSPKLVVAVGACGCSGGIFAASDSIAGTVDAVIPVDAYIPGCPPTPAMLLTGILRVLHHRTCHRTSL